MDLVKAAPLAVPQMPINSTLGAPSGSYEGGVPFIVDVSMNFAGSSVDVDINVKADSRPHRTVEVPAATP